MAKQLVVSGNRIIAHGEDCYISMGGTVICTKTERVFQNATVVNCDNIPCDLDEVGYEYHAGEFLPCGIPPLKDCAIEFVEYLGTGTTATEESPMRIPLTIDPYLIIIGNREIDGSIAQYVRIMTEQFGIYYDVGGSCSREYKFSKDGKYVTWTGSNVLNSMNILDYSTRDERYVPIEYVLIAIGKGRCN